ncbi:transcription initiation factor TFIID subunit 12-like isoform X2 [Aristolochia californica]|uniref:transcription initiation factor TFIID subunit 12-like isoform X2 n=1 Tax=Aristolochia californica TaxID=171875 RepID=UPI0035E0CE79
MDDSSMETTSANATSAAPRDPTAPATATTQQSLSHPSSSIKSTPEIPPPTSSTSSSAIPNQNPQQQQPPPKNLAPKQQNHHQQQEQEQEQQQQQQQPQQPIFQHTKQRPAQSRPRPLQSTYPHFLPHLPPTSSSATAGSSLSSPVSTSLPVTTMQRGGVAVGVPAPQVRPPQQQPTGSFSAFGPGSFNQFGGLGRGPVSVPETMANSTMQVKQPSPGVQSMGIMSPFGSNSQVRPTGAPVIRQQRPGPPPLRGQSQPNNQALATQKFQSHNMGLVPSVGSPNSQSLMAPQGFQTHPQSWASGQGKQTHTQALPSPSYKPPMKSHSMNQRSHLPQQHQQATPSSSHQQQPLAQSHQSQEYYNQQFPSPRLPQSMPHQPQVTRAAGSAAQKSVVSAVAKSSMLQSGSHTPAVTNDTPVDGTRILSKRSIQELVTQIDPSEKLDPEVEDVLVEIAEDFVEFITTFACSLAKHRKSTMLEAKDILLHLERNWNMTLPGFGGDEIKSYKKQFTNDVHKERLAAIKKSIVGSEGTNLRSSTAQAAANVKGHTAKSPPVGPEKT